MLRWTYRSLVVAVLVVGRSDLVYIIPLVSGRSLGPSLGPVRFLVLHLVVDPR